MTNNGTILIVAAGNDPSATDHYDIANIQGVINVSGVDNGNIHNGTTAQHDRVDLCAPCHQVATTDTNSHYLNTGGGTSISAPFVSATAALILSLNSCLTPPEVEYIIKATTDTIADGASYPGLLGTGRLNAYKAVLLAKDFKHEITTNTTWTGKNKYGADIVIDSGAVLTIHDTLLMGCNNHLIVKPGGKLVLDNAYLSTLRYVSGLWPGIVVEGRTNQPQIPTKQGTLVMINSVIEHAQIAVSNYKDNTYLTSGGIIQAFQSTFRNNAKSLDIKWYSPNNGNNQLVADKCYFDRCAFTVNDNFKGGDFGEHVYLEWEAGIRFKGCTFKNERTGIYFGKGTAIHTFDAGFYMTNACTGNTDPCNGSTVRNTIEGFNIGILNDGDNGFSYAASTVDQADFDKNSIGILNTTADHISVFHSNFKVGHGAPIDGSGCGQNIGIHSQNTNNFRIEENSFTGYTPNISDWLNYGIITENSGSNNNEIYKNSFATLNRACISIGCERGGQTGLRYICNNFTNNQADMVIEGAIVQNGLFHRGINELQGYEIVNNTNAYITSSGNYFVGNDTNIINNGELIFYLHNNANGYIPLHYSPLNNITLAVATNSNTCMSKLNGSVVLSAQDQADLIDNINGVSVNLNNAITTLNDALDGGQAESITNVINEPNAQETYNLLLQVAPYVSKETMRLVASSGVLSQTAMIDVLIENPDLLRDGSLMRYLCDTMDLTDISEASQYLIDNYSRSITARTEQENQINNLIHLINNGYNLLVTSAKNDTNFTYYSYIPQWLDSMKTFTAMLDKANFYFGNKQADSALATLESIHERLREQDVDSAEIANYETIYGLIMAKRNDTTHTYNFTSSDIARLQAIADANPDASAAYFAKSILTQIGAYHPIYCVTMPPLAASRQVISFGKTYQKSTTLFKAYPNPAKEVVYFNFEVPDAVNNLRIDITNLMGEHVQTIETPYKKGKLHWDTNNVPNGYYFYQLHDGNKLLSVGKISIIK